MPDAPAHLRLLLTGPVLCATLLACMAVDEWRSGYRTFDGVGSAERLAGDSRVGGPGVYNFIAHSELGVRPDMESAGASAEDDLQRDENAATARARPRAFAAAVPGARRVREAAVTDRIVPCAGVIATPGDGVNAHE